MGRAKMAEPIKLPVWMVNGAGQRIRVLDGRVHRRHMTNTVERLCAAVMIGSATRDGDAACFQIAFGNLLTSHHLFVSKFQSSNWVGRPLQTSLICTRSSNWDLRVLRRDFFCALILLMLRY